MTFTFYWNDGTREVYEAKSLVEALKDSGYGSWATTDISFIEDGDDHSYEWCNNFWKVKNEPKMEDAK